MEETELKLELAYGHDVDEAALLAIFGGDPEIVAQRSIYFDTPDHALFGAGLSLRIRQANGHYVQTIKARDAAAAGMFVRKEWECAVAGDAPVLDDCSPIPALLGARKAQIATIFDVANRRSRWLVDGIEVAFDRGDVIAADRKTSYVEIELELKAGDLGALFALARRIDGVAAVRVGVLSKAERGYRLLEAAGAARAAALALRPDVAAAEAFGAIVHGCIRQFRLNEPLIFDGRDSGALHQARAALRRLRSAIAIHRPMLTDHRAGGLSTDLRWLAAALGRARDIDVLIGCGTNDDIAAALAEKRADAYAHAIEALDAPRARRLMLALIEWTVDGDWRKQPQTEHLCAMPARDFARDALDRLWKKLGKQARDLERLDDAGRHEVRKRVKKLRYAAEFYADLFADKPARRRRRDFRAAIEAAQDQLGALNDLVTAPVLLRALGLEGFADRPDRKERLIVEAAGACETLLRCKRFWR